MSWAVSGILTYSPESIGYGQDTLIKGTLLKQFKKLLQANPDSATKQLKELRDSLCKFENMRFLIIANIETLLNPVSTWSTFIEKDTKVSDRGHSIPCTLLFMFTLELG